jgi:hypothetical protein
MMRSKTAAFGAALAVIVLWVACGTPIPFGDSATPISSPAPTSSLVPAVCSSNLNLTTGQNASLVIGQADFTSASAGTTATTLTGPQGALIISSTVYVVDNANHRVLGYNPIPTLSGPAASFALGQVDLNSNAFGSGLHQMQDPEMAQAVGNQLFVTDSGNHRVLVWNSLPASNGAAADFAFPSGGQGCAADKLSSPEMSFSDGIRMLVSDYGNNRVLIYNQIPTSGSATPDIILGQPNATTCDAGAATQSSLFSPRGVWTDGTRLLVVDQDHNRILVWNSFPTSNNQDADLVIGQPDFTTSSFDTTAQKMNVPWGVISNCNQIFVGDKNNNRVLIYNSFPSANNASADVVLGQSGFTTSTGATTQAGLRNPLSFFLDGTRLLVTDWANKRVLVYDSN